MPIRPFQPTDAGAIRRILEQTGVFRQEELDVAQELMDIVIHQPDQEDYAMSTYVDDAGAVRGYYCVGPTPATEGTYDLYWIATDPQVHGQGLGTALLHHCEEYVRTRQGRLIVVETSSQPAYDKTRCFYQRKGYREEARIRDYYARGDDLVLLTKQLQEDR
jgi:ribosomal protein S18 acetylase RimI-like enzyme